MYVFCVGMERCGTHSICKIVNHACIQDRWVKHEADPTWCREARLRFDGYSWETPDFFRKFAHFDSLQEECDLICEVNHRLGFFITNLYTKYRHNSKYIWLVRIPLDVIFSKICTYGHWPELLDKYPDFFVKQLGSYILPNKTEFNNYRILPKLNNAELYEYYAWEWLICYLNARCQLAMLPEDKVLVMKTEDISARYVDIFDFIDKRYFVVTPTVDYWGSFHDDSVVNLDNKELKCYAGDMVFGNREAISELILAELDKLSGIFISDDWVRKWLAY